MYEINQILLDFEKDEIAGGAELAAKGLVKLTVQEDRKADETFLILHADIREEEEQNRSFRASSASAVISEKEGELVAVKCDCIEYKRSRFSCRHITAALCAYVEKRDGRETLAHSPVAAILAEKTGISEPYRTGILRKTDRELTGFLRERQKAAALLPGRTPEKAGSFRVSCYLTPESGVCRLELKTGDSRLYVVKSASDFLRAYLNHEKVTLGKNREFLCEPASFEPASRDTMNLLTRIYQEGRYGGRLFSGYSGQESRYMLLSGSNLDHFMETSAVHGIYLYNNEKDPVIFSPERKELPLYIKKQEFGAVISMDDVRELARTIDYLYWQDGNRIYRIPISEADTAAWLFSAVQKKEELYIEEKDLPAVCREILPSLPDTMPVVCDGMEVQQYLPEKPVYEIYLDYPQENMVICTAYARYREKKYQLFKKENYKDNRDFAGEHAFCECLKPFFNSFDSKTASLCYAGDERGLYSFLTEDIPRLDKLGELFISDRMNRLRVVPLNTVSVGVSIKSGILELEMKSEVFSNEELAEILSAYDRKKKYHRLRNGAFVSFSEEQSAMWSALSDCMQYAPKKNPELIRMPQYRAMYLDEMLRERDGVTYSKSREYRRLLTRMKSVEDGDFEVPNKLEAVLRNYQKEGFLWLKTLKTNGFGGILADDMGLGKTLQVLAFLLSEKEEGKTGDDIRTLIVTPASLVYNWKKEIEQFVPELKICVITGTVSERERKIQEACSEGAEIWITSYDLLKRDIGLYEEITFANEVVDEAQYIKNQATNASKSVRLIRSGFRLALTGTPIENRLSELWSIFDYLMPGFLFTYTRFRQEIELPAAADQDQEAMEKMRRMVHPFILRRLKRDVLKELPDKLEEVVTVELEGEQRRLYDAHVQRLKLYLEKQSDEEFQHGKLELLAELTKLRQLCCGPELLLENYKGPNAKLDACMELVQRAIEGGHKILLFSQFTSMLDQICSRLKAEKIAYYRIDGSVNKEERMRQVDAFQEDSVPVFCISLKAGGTGLNLTAADIVIHYDPWWNAAAQNQATDRAHRIGQKNPVNVYQMIAEDTIEQKIQLLQENKQQLAEEILSGESIQSIMIRKDEVLRMLES